MPTLLPFLEPEAEANFGKSFIFLIKKSLAVSFFSDNQVSVAITIEFSFICDSKHHKNHHIYFERHGN